MGEQKSLILVIDDNAEVRQGIVGHLTDSGFEVVVASAGQEGLGLLRERNPDVVVLDGRLGDTDGLDMLAAIRVASADVPVIMVAGNGSIDDAIKSLRLGAWDYLTKPLHDLGVLVGRIREAIEHTRLTRQTQCYRNHLEEEIRLRAAELDKANRALEAKSIALNEVLGSIEAERMRFGQQVHKNVERIILPQLRSLNHGLNRNQQRTLEQIEQGLEEIVSPFIDKMSRDVASLTTTELRVCTFIKRGLAVKEIAELEHLSPETIAAHRRNIRRKLGIANRKVNLTTYLRTVFSDQEAVSR